MFLIFLWPVGLIFTWLSNWKKVAKIIVTVIIALIGIVNISLIPITLNAITSTGTAKSTATNINQSASFGGLNYLVSPTWTVDDSSDTERHYYLDANKKNEIYLLDYDLSGYNTTSLADSIAKNTYESLGAQYGVTNIDYTSTKTDGYPTYNASFKATVQNKSYTFKTSLILLDSSAVMIICGCATDVYPTYSSSYDTFLGSIAVGSSSVKLPSGSSSTSSKSSSTQSSSNHDTKVQTFLNSMPANSSVTTAQDMGVTATSEAKDSVYFYTYEDAGKSTLVGRGTYFELNSESEAKTAFNTAVQTMVAAGAPADGRIDGDTSTVFYAKWSGIYSYTVQKGNILLTLTADEAHMEHVQKFIASCTY